MRKSCWDCCRKHLSQADVLLDEAFLGYPHHRWRSVGQMGEAESEILDVDQEFAEKIRNVRLKVMQSRASARTVCIDDLIREACVRAGEDDIFLYEDPNNSKIFDKIEVSVEDPF